MPLAVHTEDDGAHAEAVIRNGAAPAPSLLLPVCPHLQTTASWSSKFPSRPCSLHYGEEVRTKGERQRPGHLHRIAISEETEDDDKNQCPFSIGEEREDGDGEGA